VVHAAAGGANDDGATGLARDLSCEADVLRLHVVEGEQHLVATDTVGDLHDPLIDILARGINGVCGAEFLGLFQLPRDSVNSNHPNCAGKDGALHRVHAHATDPDHRDRITGADVTAEHRRAGSGRDSAGDKAGLVERDIGIDLDDGVGRRDCPLAETTDHRELADVLTVLGVETEGAVKLRPKRHVRAAIAEDGDPAQAPPALAARWDEGQDDMVPRLKVGHTGADLLDDTGSFMASNDRVSTRAVTGCKVPVGVAETSCDELD